MVEVIGIGGGEDDLELELGGVVELWKGESCLLYSNSVIIVLRRLPRHGGR